MPIPPSMWKRLTAFVKPEMHGKVELDVRDGKVVGMRLIESVKPTEEELKCNRGVDEKVA